MLVPVGDGGVPGLEGVFAVSRNAMRRQDSLVLLHAELPAFLESKRFAEKMEQHILKIVNNCFNTIIYSYLETSGGQSYNPYLNGGHFFNASLN